MHEKRVDEKQIGRPAAPAVLGVALVVGLGVVASRFTSEAWLTAPPNEPQVAPWLIWAPERLGQDWPAPVRVEPAEGPVPVARMVLGDDARWDFSEGLWEPFEFGDRLADGVHSDLPWLDIREVQLSTSAFSSFRVVLAGAGPSPRPAPADAWIAYGLVLDKDDDGQADVRIGTDNMAGDEHRAWWADLRTGGVSWKAGPPYGEVGGRGEGQRGGPHVGLETWYPGEPGSGPNGASLVIWPAEQDFRFYAWASLIHDGRVVATDYAPDVAWLEPGIQPVLTFAGPIWWHETEFERGNVSFSIVQTISVTPEGRLHINAACHAGTAGLAIETNTLSVSDVSLVETDCRREGPRVEEGLIEILSAGTIAYTIDAGVLELQAGPHRLRFTARFQGPPR